MPGGKGAKGNTRPTKVEQKKQKSSSKAKDIYVSVAFLTASVESITTCSVSGEDKDREMQIENRTTDIIDHTGTMNRTSFDRVFQIDCTALMPPYEENLMPWRSDMLRKINAAANMLKSVAMEGRTGKKINLHVYVIATAGANDLAYAMAYVCAQKMADKISDAELSKTVVSKFGKFFDGVKSRGNTVKLEYMGIVELSTFFVGPPFVSSSGGSQADGEQERTDDRQKAAGRRQETPKKNDADRKNDEPEWELVYDEESGLFHSVKNPNAQPKPQQEEKMKIILL